jgi:hypothetical protein
LSFAAGVTPGPRKTRFRLAATLGRTGFQPAGSVKEVSKCRVITSRHLFPLLQASPGARLAPLLSTARDVCPAAAISSCRRQTEVRKRYNCSVDVSIAAARLALALDLFEVGEAVMKARLRRLHPAADAGEIDRKLSAWLATRPGAKHGDGAGVPGRRRWTAQ